MPLTFCLPHKKNFDKTKNYPIHLQEKENIAKLNHTPFQNFKIPNGLFKKENSSQNLLLS